jgi:hypothetical protein
VRSDSYRPTLLTATLLLGGRSHFPVPTIPVQNPLLPLALLFFLALALLPTELQAPPQPLTLTAPMAAGVLARFGSALAAQAQSAALLSKLVGALVVELQADGS